MMMIMINARHGFFRLLIWVPYNREVGIILKVRNIRHREIKKAA